MLLRRISFTALAALNLPFSPLLGQARDSAQAAPSGSSCAECAKWNAPHAPAHLFANVYFVGTNGLSAILVTSDEGHVLLDGGLPESAPLIMESIRSLGFRVEDVKLIVNSHDHYDHAGGIGELQRASGAQVAASPPSAPVLRSGTAGRDDPQYGLALPPYPAVSRVRVLADDETVRVGSLAITAHFTGGHTPGGTSWSWRSCENDHCLDFVYADSQTPISADDFSFTRNTAYPTAVRDFEHGFAVLERLRCDVLLTPHPGASRLWERLAARDSGNAGALVDREACRRYAANAREQLARRLRAEHEKLR